MDALESVRATSNSARIISDEAIRKSKRATIISIVALSVASFFAGLSLFISFAWLSQFRKER